MLIIVFTILSMYTVTGSCARSSRSDFISISISYVPILSARIVTPHTSLFPFFVFHADASITTSPVAGSASYVTRSAATKSLSPICSCASFSSSLMRSRNRKMLGVPRMKCRTFIAFLCRSPLVISPFSSASFTSSCPISEQSVHTMKTSFPADTIGAWVVLVASYPSRFDIAHQSVITKPS